jgi:hypothetical protein
MGTLLGHLAQFGSFSAQGEVLCTQALAFFLQNDTAKRALAEALAAKIGTALRNDLTWYPEAHCEDDTGRADLEGRAPDGTSSVIIEAKLSAPLSLGQLRCYALRLRSGPSGAGVLVVLVPEGRMSEAARALCDAVGVSGSGLASAEYGGVVTLVLSWDHMFDALRRNADAQVERELEAFQDMYKVLRGLRFPPLAGPEGLRSWRHREEFFLRLVEQVTRRLSKGPTVNPMTSEPIEQQAEGLEPKGYRRRYVCRPLTPDAVANPCFSIGVRDPFAGHDTPIWLRFNRTTAHFPVVRDRLSASPVREQWVIASGDIWIPLVPDFGIQDEELVGDLMAKAEAILRFVYG